MFKLVPCKQTAMCADTVTNYGLNTIQHYFIIMAVLYRVLSLQCNVFKLVSCQETTIHALTCSYKCYTALFSNNGNIGQALHY